MDKKLLISLGLIAALTAGTISVMADTTIYTDSIGRLHFLGRDAANNVNVRNKYTNPAEQELTRKLYSEDREVNYDENFDQHPVKNYENTFPDSRFKTKTFWDKNYVNDTDASRVDVNNTSNVDASKGIPTTSERPSKKERKTSVSATQGARYGTNPYIETTSKSSLQEDSVNIIKNKTPKKHWWNKNKN